jgi:hypothetical protein
MTGKQRAAHCMNCDVPLSRARLVIAGWWWCPDCAYELEHEGPADRRPTPARRDQENPAGRASALARRSRRGPQEETLFPLAPFEEPPAR